MSLLYGWLASYSRFFQVIKFLLIAFAVFLCFQHHAFAADIGEIVVNEKDGVYHIRASAEIAAEEEYVRQVLTDYEHVYRLNFSIIESEVLESPVAENVRVRTRLLYCISIFCLDFERLDEISTLKSGDLQAVIVPEESDFHSGKAIWKLTSIGNKTQLIYLASIKPDFFIPPVLDTIIVNKHMREEFSATFSRIEHIAHINEERDWDVDYMIIPVADRINNVPCNDTVNAGSK